MGANWVEFRAVNKLGEPHHATTTAIDIQNFINARPFITFQKIGLALCFLVVAACPQFFVDESALVVGVRTMAFLAVNYLSTP